MASHGENFRTGKLTCAAVLPLRGKAEGGGKNRGVGRWCVMRRAVFDYLGGGGEGEVTVGENCGGFEEVTFRPRQAVTVPQCELRTRLLGFEVSFPALLAPVGYSRLMHPGGEVAAARTAGLAGTAYILSTISGHSLENVKASSSGPVLYQLYLLGGREVAESAIERARTAGFSALVVTIDTPVAGIRERAFRNAVKQLLIVSPLAT